MFQHLGPRYCAVFGDMADEQDGSPRRFGVFKQHGGALPYLRYAAGRRLQYLTVNRLDGVDDHQVGADGLGLSDYLFEEGFRVDEAFPVASGKPACPHLDLLRRLFARHVECSQPPAAEGKLQGHGRFADARLPAEQYERPPDHASAQHAVHFGAACVEPPVVYLLDFPYGNGACLGACETGSRFFVAAADHFLGKRIPFAACRAFAEPFGRFVPAGRTEICFFYLCHRRVCFRSLFRLSEFPFDGCRIACGQ